MARAKAKQLKPKRPKTKGLVSKKATVEADEYSAAGGMPFAERSQAVLGDRSGIKRTTQELSWVAFDRHVQELARATASFKAEAVVGIAHGGVFVGGAIASALKVEFFPVRLTRRSRDTRTSRLADEMPPELKGRRVLVVDDICSSGDSLELAVRLAKKAGAAKVKTVALVTRPGGHAPDVTALTSETFFVFPWDYQAVVDDERFETKKQPRSTSRKTKGDVVADDDVVLGV